MVTLGADTDMSSPLNYGTPSSLSTPRSLMKGAMTPARQRADLRGHQQGPTVPAPTPTRRVKHYYSLLMMDEFRHRMFSFSYIKCMFKK